MSINSNATILNTLNGIDYQWLELTETANMSRQQVQLEIYTASVGDVLYGYGYASRQLFEDLLLSYMSFDGISGFHGDTGAVNGGRALLTDFGALHSGTGFDSLHTVVDGESVFIDSFIQSRGIYGLEGECGFFRSCYSEMTVFSDTVGNDTMVNQNASQGFDASAVNAFVHNLHQSISVGSWLVTRVSTPVPEPHIALLIGSGLLLIAVSRRKA